MNLSAVTALAGQASARLALRRVSLADVFDAPEPAQRYAWAGRIPCEQVTLLGAHGGTGKSMFALQLAAHVAAGRPFLGAPVQQGRVIFLSAEDGVATLRRRLAQVCQADGFDPAEVARNLDVIDASDTPTLYREVSDRGVKRGELTNIYRALQADIEARPVSLLVIDNASDTFDANEIERASVRAYVQALARLVRSIGGAVLLLAHVAKTTARARGKASDAESYSGSTAWHNSARSRLALSVADDGSTSLTLTHQKNNVGPKLERLELLMRPDGTLTASAAAALVAGPDASTVRQLQRDQLLRLVHEFTQRGEFVSPSINARTHAHAMFRGEAGFPNLPKPAVTSILRDAERAGLIRAEEYRTPQRKASERWALTDAGLAAIGEDVRQVRQVADDVHGAADAVSAKPGAPSAPGSALGVWGEERAHLAQLA